MRVRELPRLNSTITTTSQLRYHEVKQLPVDPLITSRKLRFPPNSQLAASKTDCGCCSVADSVVIRWAHATRSLHASSL